MAKKVEAVLVSGSLLFRRLPPKRQAAQGVLLISGDATEPGMVLACAAQKHLMESLIRWALELPQRTHSSAHGDRQK